VRVYTRAVFCDNGSSICHVDSKGWALPMCVAGAYSPRRFGIDGDHAGSSGDAIQVRRARGAESAPQPNLVPFMPSRSRKTHSKGMSDGASRVWDSPLIFNVTDRPPHASPEVVDIDPSDVEQNLPNGSVVRHGKVRVSMTAICALNGSDILSAATR